MKLAALLLALAACDWDLNPEYGERVRCRALDWCDGEYARHVENTCGKRSDLQQIADDFGASLTANGSSCRAYGLYYAGCEIRAVVSQHGWPCEID